MKIQRWQLKIAALLTGLAVAFYAIRWFAFPDPALHAEMLRYLVDDLAFLFVQVLVVTMLIDTAMQSRAREELNRKLNMVIGAFFSQAGTELLARIASADVALAAVREGLVPAPNWTATDFDAARDAFRSHDARISLDACDLSGLRDVLTAQRPHLLGLLTNQSLLEHESFTDLLWALTHLAEELAARPNLSDLKPADRLHLEGDTKRAYVLLGAQWIDYLCHLRSDYPYLFSLAVRTNPLDPSASVEVA